MVPSSPSPQWGRGAPCIAAQPARAPSVPRPTGTGSNSVLRLGQFGSIDAGGSHRTQDHVVLHIRIRGRENETPGAPGFAEANVHADARRSMINRPAPV